MELSERVEKEATSAKQTVKILDSRVEVLESEKDILILKLKQKE